MRPRNGIPLRDSGRTRAVYRMDRRYSSAERLPPTLLWSRDARPSWLVSRVWILFRRSKPKREPEGNYEVAVRTI